MGEDTSGGRQSYVSDLDMTCTKVRLMLDDATIKELQKAYTDILLAEYVGQRAAKFQYEVSILRLDIVNGKLVFGQSEWVAWCLHQAINQPVSPVFEGYQPAELSTWNSVTTKEPDTTLLESLTTGQSIEEQQ